jgi:hypothetical protein
VSNIGLLVGRTGEYCILRTKTRFIGVTVANIALVAGFTVADISMSLASLLPI